MLSSTLDFLYLGNTGHTRASTAIPSPTMRAARTIKKRCNDLHIQVGNAYMNEIVSCITPAQPYLNKQPLRTNPTRSCDQDVLQFAEELIHKGLVKGEFKLLEASWLDLPTRAPPASASHWIHLLPPSAQATLGTDQISKFKDSISFLHDTAVTIPSLRVHCNPAEYSHVLARLSLANMIEWSLVKTEKLQYSRIADILTMTSFAVVKDDLKDRIISWPRMQNLQFPEPPHTNLPHPGHFAKLREAPNCSLTAFYNDVKNMFHNIRLPPHLASIFPLKKIAFGNLPGRVQLTIAKELGFRPRQQDLLRPMQTTLPMGFKWAVYIAHNFLEACYRKALHHFFQSSSIFGITRSIPPIEKLHDCLGTPLSSGCVLVMHIIDDLNFVLSNWPESEAIRLQRTVEEFMLRNYLPIKRSKSSPIGTIETKSLPFIGWEWNLKDGIIRPKPNKILEAAKAVSRVLHGPLQAEEVRSVVGRLIWVLLGSRPLLSMLYRTFQFLQNPTSSGQAVEFAVKRELAMSASLSCLSQIRITRKEWNRVIAFDACEYGGAVVYTDTTDEWIQQLSQCSFHPFTSCNPEHMSSPPHSHNRLEEFIRNHKWKTAFTHHWRREQHINALEAHTGILAVEWAISCDITGQRIILLSDSLVTVGAFKKGRSSSAMLCLLCRKFAALVTAHDLDVL